MKKMNLARSSDIRSMYINQFYFYMPAELCKMGFNKMNPFPKVSEYKMYQKKKKKPCAVEKGQCHDCGC